MKTILFVHQNFPGQYKHLAPALAVRGDRVIALTIENTAPTNGVEVVRYTLTRGMSQNIHPLLAEQEVKLIRAESCARAAEQLKQRGIYPDIICAHPGWGEAIFLKDIFPNAALLLFHEFFYHLTGFDMGFDPEFYQPSLATAERIRIKNTHLLLSFNTADALVTPTYFQASTLPDWALAKTTIIHDGINTQLLTPHHERPQLEINGQALPSDAPIITFVNRNLEPYRGYHQFMRALPLLQKNHPNAHILIVGGDKTSYGAAAPQGQSWKQIFLNEVADQLKLSHVHFVGNLNYNAFISLLRASDVHVYLTYPFVLSWSLIEAMSLECAIVASDTAPLREVIRHEENGLLVDFFDPLALATQISRLINNRSLAKTLGQHARRDAISRYDLHTVCLPQHIALIDRLIASHMAKTP